MKCPGQDRGYWTGDRVFEVPCPRCGSAGASPSRRDGTLPEAAQRAARLDLTKALQYE